MSFIVSKIIGNPLVLVWLVAGAFLLGLTSGGSAAWWIQGVRLDHLGNEFTKFRNDTEALGKQALVDKAAKEAADKLKKETSDARLKTANAALAADNKRMRDDRANGRFVPTAAADSRSPELACYDRAELESTLQRHDEGVTRLFDEGDKNTLRLKSAQDWAQPGAPK